MEKKNRRFLWSGAFVLAALLLPACGGETGSTSQIPGGSSNTGSGGGGSHTSMSSHDQAEVDAYMDALAESSEANHFYYHYLRYDSSAASYADWDVWAWPYRPSEQEGAKFDWIGRNQGTDDLKTATGNATVDSFGYASVDIDLSASHDGGWNNTSKKIGGTAVSFADSEQIGLQIVKTATRTTGSGFWVNDGSNVYATIADYALTANDGTVSYHAFVTQDQVQNISATPAVSPSDPFADDDGTNETYNSSTYSDVDWSTSADIAATSPKFLESAGVGYQIMVASFADSDGDGFGDIYGIVEKLDYIKNLGVNAIWLTPIQSSDSYHGYDITDYLTVDPKFGSTASPAAVAANGVVSAATAMADYKLLLEEAHERNMLVVMDLVINHTSTGNKWFVDSAQLSETMRGYYRWANHDTHEDITEENCWYPYGDHVYSYYAKFGSSMPELNFAYSGTRAAVKSIALNWCEIGVDGFRMDAVKHIFMRDEIAYEASDTYVVDEAEAGDYSSDLTKNLHFWRDLNAAIKAEYPNCFIVGENFDGHAYHVAPYYEGFDSLFDFYSYYNLTSLAAKGLSGNTTFSATAASWTGATVMGTPYSASSDTGISGGTGSIKYGGHWNLREVLSANNQYRGGAAMEQEGTEGYVAINGTFTSNHDISRSINRVAGTAFNADGLTAQGTITQSNYAEMNAAATCVQIAQLMLPGLTWIYYGDELGMTGNFPATDRDGNPFTANSDYADLYYRQAMKWRDENERPGYGITGSGLSVELDSINRSSLVADAETQMASENSHYSAIKAFATAKGTTPALIRGNFTPWGWDNNPYMMNFQRKLGSESYHVVVNLGPTASGAGFVGEVVASYNGASLTSIPAYSAVLIKE